MKRLLRNLARLAFSASLLTLLGVASPPQGISAFSRPGNEAPAETNATPPPVVTTNFEQDLRINSLQIKFTTDTFATTNHFGSAFTGNAQTQLQAAIDASIADGTISLLFEMLDLADLTGTAGTNLTIGVVNGGRVSDAGNPTTYNGTSDLDWWYAPEANEVTQSFTPTTQLSGSIAAKALTVGPGSLTLDLSPSSALRFSNLHIVATVDVASTPLTSSNNFPPGHLPSENIPPALQSFGSTSAGKLTGNISAQSLASAPIPAAFVGSGLFNCTQAYSAADTWLDLLVSGCTRSIVGNVVSASQPDQVDVSVPVAGAGAPYVLSASAGHVVNTCRDKNAAVVTLRTCLDAATYSSYFQFTTDRVIVKPTPYADSDGDGYLDRVELVLGENPASYCPIMRADVDGDGSVSILDLAAAAGQFLQSIPPANPRFNQDGDANISILDLATMASHFLQTVSACP